MKSKATVVCACASLLSACDGGDLDGAPQAVGDARERVSAASVPDLGIEASLHGKPTFTTMNDPTKLGYQWTLDVSQAAVDPNSTTLLVNGMGLEGPAELTSVPLHPNFGSTFDGAPIGMPYVIVPGNQPLVPVTFFGAPSQSDPGPYPIPPDAPIEGGATSTGDRHVLVVDRDHWKLYETYDSTPVVVGGVVVGWQAYSGAIFDLNRGAYRPRCWTSADAAGLPIFPGLIRYDEVFEQGVVAHAVRFTLPNTRPAFIAPATHYASTDADPTLPPMGMRVRLKASYSIDARFAPEVQVMLQALKTYGMILADNGSSLYAIGTNDARWDNDDLATMSVVTAGDFEVVSLAEDQIFSACD
jgi:hypothetical protein